MPKDVQGHKTFKNNLTNRSAGFLIQFNNQSELRDI